MVTSGDGPSVFGGACNSGGSGTVPGAGGLSTAATSVTYSGDQVNVGTYFVTAHYAGDSNHEPSDGSPVGIAIIKPPSTTVTLSDEPFVYSGSTNTGGSGTVTRAGGLSTPPPPLTHTRDPGTEGRRVGKDR